MGEDVNLTGSNHSVREICHKNCTGVGSGTKLGLNAVRAGEQGGNSSTPAALGKNQSSSDNGFRLASKGKAMEWQAAVPWHNHKPLCHEQP